VREVDRCVESMGMGVEAVNVRGGGRGGSIGRGEEVEEAMGG